MGDVSDFQRRHGWCAFTWSISNLNGHFIRCIESSNFQGYDSTNGSLEDIISWEEQWPKPKTKWRGSSYIRERIVSKNQRTAAAKVTAELNIHLEDPVFTKTVRRELYKSKINGKDAIAKLLITEKSTKRQRHGVMILTHCGRVTQFCVFNTVKLGTSASSL